MLAGSGALPISSSRPLAGSMARLRTRNGVAPDRGVEDALVGADGERHDDAAGREAIDLAQRAAGVAVVEREDGDVVAVGVGDVDDGRAVADASASVALIDRSPSAGPECVTAPRCAGPTSFAYFSSTPLSTSTARGRHAARRRAISASSTRSDKRAALAVDADAVAVANERDRPAERRLGADVADHQAARRAREASVGEERDLLAHALAVDERGDAEHLAHAGPAARPFVADDEDVAFGIRAFGDRREGILLALEDARRTLEHARLQAGDLDQRAVGREVAFQDDDAAGRVQRVRGRANDFAVGRRRARELVGERPARQRERVAVQMAGVEQRLQHRRDAADAVQVEGEEAPAGLQVGDQRRAREHRGDVVEREAHAGLVRDRRQVQAGVGRAAGRGDRGAGVLERLARDEVARQRPAFA